MGPDFSSIQGEDSRPDEHAAFRPTQSASELLKRKRDRLQRARARACKNVARYAAYVACIGLFAGCAQLGTGVFNGLPVSNSAWFVVRTLCGAALGAFVGVAIVALIIASPIVPMGPVTIIRIGPNIADAEQEEDESRALLGAGIVFASIGAVIASATVPIDEQLYSSILSAGVIGSIVGAIVVIFLVLLRRLNRRSITRADMLEAAQKE